MFQINPKIPETDALKHWYEEEGNTLHWMSLTQSSALGGGTSSGDFSAGANMKTIMVCYDVIVSLFVLSAFFQHMWLLQMVPL